jgi:hypothetical protein
MLASAACRSVIIDKTSCFLIFTILRLLLNELVDWIPLKSTRVDWGVDWRRLVSTKKIGKSVKDIGFLFIPMPYLDHQKG